MMSNAEIEKYSDFLRIDNLTVIFQLSRSHCSSDGKLVNNNTCGKKDAGLLLYLRKSEDIFDEVANILKLQAAALSAGL